MNNIQPRYMRDNINPLGKVERRLYSGSKLKNLIEQDLHISMNKCMNNRGIIDFNALCIMAIESGISPQRLAELKEQSAKKQFADNRLWRFLKKHFNLDIAIPGITGNYTLAPLKGNLVVNTGHAAYAGQISGITTAPFTAMAYGTGAVAAAATDTALGAEVARAAATITRVTTTSTNDTTRWEYTFTAGGNQAITEEGIFDNNTSGGNMLARQVFAAVNMVLNDTLQFTHSIQA